MAIGTFNEARRLRDTGELRAAAKAFLRAADVFEISGPAELYAAALVEAGRAFMAVGEPAQAIAPLRQAVAVLREILAAATLQEVADKAARDLARVSTNLGQAFGELDDPDAALAQFGEALRIAREQDEHLYAWTALSVGKLFRELKRPEDARGYLTDAYEVFTRLQDRRQAALAANNLGAVHNDLDEHEPALARFEQARAVFAELGDTILKAKADANIARQQFALGELGDARRSIDAALRRLTEPGNASAQAAALTTKSRILWSMDEKEQAVAVQREAVDLYGRVGRSIEHASALGRLAGNLMELKSFDEGLALLEQSIDELERVHDALQGSELRAFQLDRINEAFAVLVASYVHADRPYSALAAAERAKARTLALLLSGVAGEDTGEHRERLMTLQRELGAAREALRCLGPSPAPAEITRLERRERELQLALRSLEASLGVSLAASPTRECAGPAGPAHELQLHYVIASTGSFLLAQLGDVVEAHSLPASGDLEPLVRQLREDLQLGLMPAHADTLYRLLLRPVEHLLKASAEILIVPDGVLLDLPFAVLTRSESARVAGEHLARWSEQSWLVLTHTLRYAPSARVAAVLAARQAERATQHRQIAAFAAPLDDGTDKSLDARLPSDAVRAAERTGATLTPLPFAFEETKEVCRELGLRRRLIPPVSLDWEGFAVRSHEAATKSEVIELARRGTFRYWHFACHGLVDVELSGHSGLILTGSSESEDSYWRAYEVAGVSLPCELATLSACDTGRGRVLRGEGVLGLSRAFLTAGADAVCVSMWPVVDHSSATLMADMYRALAAGAEKPAALRAAQCTAIDRDLHPRHWGAFTLIGCR
jgi:CHAT domain-containing protein/tetratricopeptide (TPR) repeat protein